MRSARLVLALAAVLALSACKSKETPTEPTPTPAAAVEPETPNPEKVAPPPPVEGLTQIPLDAASSKVTFVGTKNGGVEVGGSFAKVSGSLSVDADDLTTLSAELDVLPGSIDTANPPRDLNIREALFELAADAMGTGHVSVVTTSLEATALEIGASTAGKADLKLDIAGHVGVVTARVELTRTADDAWTVKTAEPVVLSLKAFGMETQAAALKERCAHEQLGDAVTVSVELAFAR